MVKTIEFLPKIRYISRPAFKLLLSCVGGVLLFSCGQLLIGSIILAVIIVGLLSSSLFIKDQSTQVKLQSISLLLILAILFSWYAQLRTSRTRQWTKGITLYDTKVQIIHPIASSLESERQFYAKVRHNGSWYNLRLRIPNDELLPEAFHFGSTLSATIDLSSLDQIKNKNYRNYLLSEGYHAQGTVQDITNIVPSKHQPLSSRMQFIRYKLVENLETISAENRILNLDERGLIYALCLGDRSHLPTALKASFTSSGVAHILAVSGYHLGVIFVFLSLFLNKIFPHYAQRKIRYTLLSLGLILYTFLSGGSTATIRALVMSILAISARLMNSPSDPIQLLSTTLIIFLIINPYSYLSVGLWLSVGAVWGIFVFLPIFQEYLHTKIKPLQYLTNIILVSISAQLGVIPLLLFFFGTTSFSFIWSNIPLIILSGLLIPFGLGVLFILPLVGTLPEFIFEILRWLSEGMIQTTAFFAELSSGVTIRFDLPLLLLYYLFMIILYPLLHRKANRHRLDQLSYKSTTGVSSSS